MPSPAPTAPPRTATRPARTGPPGGPVPGLAVAVLLASAATWLGLLAPVVGGPVFGITLGVLAGTAIRRALPPAAVERLLPGFAAAGRQVLQLSIVVLGTGLSLTRVLRVGGQSLPVMLGTLAVALAGAWAGGRLLRLPPDATTLIGVGTGICGASAIAATTAVIGAAEADVAYAMGTIFTFNIAAVLLFPALGHLLGLSQQAFGLWSGTAVNDTSSVVAAAYSYGSAAGGYAVVVKLTRSLMIVPVSLGLHALRLRRGGTAPEPRTAWWRALPVFILGFLAASALDTAGGIPASWHPGLALLGTFLITVALSGIGLSLRPAQLRAAGPRPLLLGALLWVLVATTSLGIQAALGQL